MTGTTTRRRTARQATPAPAIASDERKKLLIRLLRSVRLEKTVSRKVGDDMLEHACILRGQLESSVLREVGAALSKVEGEHVSDSDPELAHVNLWG